jgi:hypothetical protein
LSSESSRGIQDQMQAAAAVAGHRSPTVLCLACSCRKYPTPASITASFDITHRGRIVSSRRRWRCIKIQPGRLSAGLWPGPRRIQRRPELVITARRPASYLKPGSGRLCCNRRGCLWAFSCAPGALPEQCLRRKPGANPLFTAVLELGSCYPTSADQARAWSGDRVPRRLCPESRRRVG